MLLALVVKLKQHDLLVIMAWQNNSTEKLMENSVEQLAMFVLVIILCFAIMSIERD